MRDTALKTRRVIEGVVQLCLGKAGRVNWLHQEDAAAFSDGERVYLPTPTGEHEQEHALLLALALREVAKLSFTEARAFQEAPADVQNFAALLEDARVKRSLGGQYLGAPRIFSRAFSIALDMFAGRAGSEGLERGQATSLSLWAAANRSLHWQETPGQAEQVLWTMATEEVDEQNLLKAQAIAGLAPSMASTQEAIDGAKAIIALLAAQQQPADAPQGDGAGQQQPGEAPQGGDPEAQQQPTDAPQGDGAGQRPPGEAPQGGDPEAQQQPTDAPQGDGAGQRPPGEAPQGGDPEAQQQPADAPQGDGAGQQQPADAPQGDGAGQQQPDEAPQGGDPEAQQQPADAPQGDGAGQRPPGEAPQGGDPEAQQQPADAPQGDGAGQQQPGEAPQGGDPVEQQPADAPQGDGAGQQQPGEAPQGGDPAEQQQPADAPQGDGAGQQQPGEAPQGGDPAEQQPADAPQGDGAGQQQQHGSYSCDAVSDALAILRGYAKAVRQEQTAGEGAEVTPITAEELRAIAKALKSEDASFEELVLADTADGSGVLSEASEMLGSLPLQIGSGDGTADGAPDDAMRLLSGVPARLVSVLLREMQDKRRRPTKLAASGSRVDPGRTWRIKRLGDTQVFRKRAHRHGIDAGVSILLDRSGSMESEIDQAAEVAYGLAVALGRISGVKTSVDLFPARGSSSERVLGFKECVNHARDRLQSVTAFGGTPTGSAMSRALDLLLDLRCEKRLIFIVTDGRPSLTEADLLGETMRLAANAGVLVVAIGIGERAQLQGLFPNHVCVDTVASLADALEGLFKNLVLDWLAV